MFQVREIDTLLPGLGGASEVASLQRPTHFGVELIVKRRSGTQCASLRFRMKFRHS